MHTALTVLAWLAVVVGALVVCGVVGIAVMLVRGLRGATLTRAACLSDYERRRAESDHAWNETLRNLDRDLAHRTSPKA